MFEIIIAGVTLISFTGILIQVFLGMVNFSIETNEEVKNV